MASKKTVTKRGAHKAPKVKVLIQLSRRAKREADKLLKRSKAGTITKEQLNTGLKEVAAPLKQMLDYIDATLDNVSKLQKRTAVRTITTKQLNIDLRKIDRGVNRMLNHEGPSHH
jgi:hypothetical protein